MELQDIAKRMESYIKDDQFLLSDETTTQTNDISTLLNEAYQVTTLEIRQVFYQFADKITLEGHTVLEGQNDVNFTVIFENAKDNPQAIICSVSAVMPKSWQMPLDEQNVFFVSEVITHFQKQIGVNLITGTLSGLFKLSDLDFHAAGNYQYEGHKWCIEFTTDESFTTRTLMEALDHYAHLGIPSDVIPDVAVKRFLLGYEGKGESIWDKLTADVDTGCDLLLTDQLGIKSFGVSLQKRNTSYSFCLKGSVVIATTSLPIYLQMRDEAFEFGVETGNTGCPLPSLSDVGDLLGITDGLSVFPKEVAEGKNLTLWLFTMDAPYSLKQLNQFYVTITIDSNWSFFGIESLVLKTIKIGFYRQTIGDKVITGFIIIGTISISDFDVQIGGTYDSESGWTLQGGFPAKEELYLDRLLVSFAQMLGIESITALPIPEITLYDVQVTFALTSKTFKAHAKNRITAKADPTILDKLFEIRAEVTIESELMGNERNYKGQFKGILDMDGNEFIVTYDFDTKKISNSNNHVSAEWKPLSDKDVITLVKILNFFGIKDVPSVISDLNFYISGVRLDYDIDKGELAINVETNVFEKINVVISGTDYIVDIILNDKIALSMLPIVGTYLHLLDNLAVEHLELYASSKDNKAKGTLSGAAILGVIYEMPFILQIYQSAPNQNGLTHSGMYDLTDRDGNLNALVTADNSSSGMTKWFTLNKSFSIFEFYRFGVGYIDGRIAFLLDAALASKPIELGLLGLGIGLKLDDPKDVAFYLSGLKIAFDNGVLSIGGAFLKSTLGDQESYEGQILIKTGDLAIFAMGIYSGKSLFVSALVNKNFGGPPVFFVTGLAASFGYNMGVKIPDIDGVANFPLVSGALGNIDQDQMRIKLKEKLTIEEGEVFLAAGIKFTSFKMIESFALVTVSFGNETEINLLGLSQVSVPPNLGSHIEPIAFAQLALKITVNPKSGLFSMMAKLTSESYILSKNCKLTGGFAFYVWFSGEYAGDFVVTLGGYHPDYKKPAHYPVVPRLGFHWDVTSDLKLSGDLYFALTPSALMAGGRLAAVYSKGCIKAWFKAEADFYIGWKPFFYDARLFVGFGVSVKVHLLFVHTTINVELSAGLHIWGPEFSGEARISLYIISFTIGFGAGSPTSPPKLNWNEFATSFLPENERAQVANQERGSDTHSTEPQTVMPLSVKLGNGQRGENEVDDKTVPAIGAEGAEFIIQSAIPITALFLDGVAIVLSKDLPQVGVLPMGEGKTLQSTFSITVKHSEAEPLQWICEPIYASLPNAVWGIKKSEAELIKGVAIGVRIRPVERKTTTFPKDGYIDLNQLSIYACIERLFTWNLPWQLPSHSQEHPIETFSKTIMADNVCNKRKEWIQSMNTVGFDFDTNIDLEKMAKEADNIFTEEMILGVLI
ncbi:DUF6603 domain-containing protein [Fusibacter sp. 3D3]|uniref:DUF6603 domain-containing protein n=1 Tax=Fusibacter sp. 3D3 TaxID=1048380 RepID=UPI0008533628|nr:DUF6603 domain-containing protein [Fusibacter sp. 3D3]GAU76005.1 putative transcriptionalactivator SRCAP homolog [Fusibacter sp. 3D3]